MAVAPKTTGDTLTVASKLPMGIVVDHAGQRLLLVGSNAPGSVAGFGLTPGVDADWFASWVAANQDFESIRSGLIFANAKPADAAAQATERTAIVDGFEGVDPKKPEIGIEPEAV